MFSQGADVEVYVHLLGAQTAAWHKGVVKAKIEGADAYRVLVEGLSELQIKASDLREPRNG